MHASPRQIRWALLATTVVMSVVLLATGMWSIVATHTAALSLTHSQVVGVSMAARRALRTAGGLDAEAVQEAVAELRSEGVGYLGVVDAEGKVVVSAGEPAPATTWRPAELAHGPRVQASRKGFGVRMQVPLLEGPRRGGMGAGRFGRRWWHGGDAEEPGVEPGPGLGPGHGPWQALRGHLLVIELESADARWLAAQAHLTLLADLVAAALLLGLGAVFWRLSRQAEETSAQLARDGQLKALGGMSALLGHELRNPLTSLKGHVQLLLEKLPADHQGRRGAETVLRETVRLENLSRQVLEFARTGSVELANEDPVALARAAADSAGDPRVRIAVTGEAQPWPLDRARMEEVLVNLLRNAVEASPSEQPIDLMVAIRAGQELTYEVRDHGEGLAPGDEERIFEPFYTRKSKGTGLGLALARRIVEGHGGRISAGNLVDGGAAFRVSLPWRKHGVLERE
jgi:two-component system, NtrC family, sensor histidine kinase HydH